MSKFISGSVDNVGRAGRAPYNFVPLPEKVRWIKEEFGPDQVAKADQFAPKRFSGEIEIEMKAVSDFYVRGMWPLEQFIRDRKEVKQQPEPFQAAGKLRLPGSSLRGMFRSLIEILADCPLYPINDNPMFFRAVGASGDPNENSFEPNATAYKQRISPGAGTPSDPAFPIVQAGFLWAEHGSWKIRPAKIDPSFRTQWFRASAPNTDAPPAKIWFKPAPPRTDSYPHSPVWYRFGIVANGEYTPANGSCPVGWEPGYLIRSKMPGKDFQWIVHEPDPAAPAIELDPADVTAYLEDRNRKAPSTRYPGVMADPTPCFYTEWSYKGEKHITFGHTPHFRLPYRNRPSHVNPAHRGKDRRDWDLAQAMFGRTPEDGDCGAARGRVFFEDAQLHPGSPEPPVQAIPKHLLLAGPKPTTYQHYLVQKATDRPDGILHWDGNYNATNTSAPVLRGFKRYWHRAPKSLPTSALATKSTSTVRLANSGCTFRARIRVENLSTEELGALLTAIELPTGCAHQLGMGKPIGLGSFETRLLSITRCDRKKRYEELFDRDSTWCTGSAAPLPPPRRQAFMDYFAFWMGRSNSARLWATPRMIELKALLSLENRDKPGWENATRYLEIERPTNGGKVNEYKKPGKVRALPPAGDVWRMGREIPRD